MHKISKNLGAVQPRATGDVTTASPKGRKREKEEEEVKEEEEQRELYV